MGDGFHWMLQSGDQTNGFWRLQTTLPNEHAGNQNKNFGGFEDICSGIEHLAVNDANTIPKDLEEILSGRIDINTTNANGDGVLHIFTARNDVHTVKLLLTYGADVNLLNKKRQTCLHIAAVNGFHSILHLLLEKNANPNIGDIKFHTPLMLATEAVDMKAVLILLQAGAHIGNITKTLHTDLYLLIKTFRGSGEGLCLKPLDSKLNYMDIYDAATKDDDELMSFLKEMEANFDVCQPVMLYTALHRCAMNGDINGVQRLFEAGASLDARDIRGRTPYDIAVVTGNKSTANYLLKLIAEKSRNL